MSRFVEIFFVAVVVVLVEATCANNFVKPKVVNLELTQKDLTPGIYTAPHADSFIGDLSVGEVRGDEQFYVGSSEYENDSTVTVSLQLTLSINSGIINVISAENVGDSRSVVCATANTLGSNKSVLSVRIPAKSRLRLSVIIGAH